MTNYATGHKAEVRAADYLKKRGYKILNLNWKTKYCEIDIVAQRKNTIYFVEVKYRKGSAQGIGLDYITTGKLRQMKFAAELWVVNNQWLGEYQLAALSMSNNEIIFIDEIWTAV